MDGLAVPGCAQVVLVHPAKLCPELLTRSVTGGARRLLLTQPAVSRQLQALEREIGGPLLERRALGVEATPAGLLLAREARRLLEAVDGPG